MRTVAITGASGFVGRQIARAAVQSGWRVRALARSPETLPPEFSPLRWEIENPMTVPLDGVDAIVHGAAYRPTDLDDPSQADACMRINAGGTLALLMAAQSAGIQRFVYLSAGNAYNSAYSPIPETAQLFPAQRATYYLASKLMGDIFVSHWDQAGKMPSCILRISSVYGPEMDRRGFIAATACKLAAGLSVSLRNGGSFSADMVYVGDVARAAVTALDVPFRGAINVGAGNASNMREIADMLVEIIGARPDLIHADPPSQVSPEPGFGALDITLARQVLGYMPTPLREGLTRTWHSLRENT
jgi:UDP-glucose 4-epimerase